ncbi:hypothetical protein BCR33DRAFT_718976 [Rhizoclosmatium globosum]|uniref:G-protein coupled receptors family 3 profile domain-containing protein n=1 Tax=Rhizoclosmatium globosum TaxID=329046 RepID=A0A1Y2C2V9_9FUNG|nr:hypothetical protein BCR33DRAFT_718976 [Rhizoclosmatium globosum]|eukprot:ORY41370.1 hypothetical protein BCR33DRAFT_718976 [Rhizoclosmatium globosum]
MNNTAQSLLMYFLLWYFTLISFAWADKTQSSITIGFLGPYSAVPGVKLNGTLVSEYSKASLGANIIRYNGYPSNLGLIIWNDVGAQIAVDTINQNPNILPNTTIKIKRFNDLDPNRAHLGYGYAMKLAMSIQEQHPDSGAGDAICLLLKLWNVKRVALLTYASSKDILDSLNRCNVRILVLSIIRDNMAVSDILQIGTLLKHYDTRRNISYGPGYVWLGTSTPLPLSDGSTLLGPAYNDSLIDGYIFIGNSNPPSSNYLPLYKSFVNSANRFTTLYGQKYNFTTRTLNPLSGLTAYDCLGVLASGISNIMSQTSTDTVVTRAAQSYLNTSAFMDTGFRGFSADPVQFLTTGDLAVMYVFVQLTASFDYNEFASTNMNKTAITILDNTLPIFAGNTTIPPPDGLIFSDLLFDYSSPLGEVLLILSICGICICILDCTFMFLFRKTSIIRSQIPNFSYTIAAGAILGYASSYFDFGMPTISKCVGKTWMTLSLFAKNLKLGLIYNAKQVLSKFYVGDVFWFMVAGSLIMFDVILLSFWTWESHLYISSRNDSVYGFEILAFRYHTILLLLCSHTAYYGRNIVGIHSNFSYLVTLILSVVLFLGIEFLLAGAAPSWMFQRYTETLITFILLSETILLKFVAKIMGIWAETESSNRLKSLIRNRSSNNSTVKAPSGRISRAPSVQRNPELIITTKRNTAKGVRVVYRVQGMGTTWISALCLLNPLKEGCFLLMLSFEPDGEPHAYRLTNNQHKIISDSDPARVVVSYGDSNKLVIDFTSSESRQTVLLEIAKYFGSGENE